MYRASGNICHIIGRMFALSGVVVNAFRGVHCAGAGVTHTVFRFSLTVAVIPSGIAVYASKNHKFDRGVAC